MATFNDIGIDPRWIATYSKVRLENEVGRGGFGTVHVGLYQDQKVAVKKLHSVILSPQIVEKMRREINIMAGLHHPNILTFIAAVFDNPDGDPMIITELVDMSLSNAIEKRLLTSEREKLTIMRDAAAGLNYLHCLPDPIICRDVSSFNVLLVSRGSGRWITKISDFGLAITISDFKRDEFLLNSFSTIYNAPETFTRSKLINLSKKHLVKMDVYSYGILVTGVLVNQSPDHEHFRDMLNKIQAVVPSMYSLIVQCIAEDPKDRPSMKSILKHIDQIGKYIIYGTCHPCLKELARLVENCFFSGYLLVVCDFNSVARLDFEIKNKFK